MKPMLEGIRCILFDAVGTLIYPEPSVAEVYHGIGRSFGSQLQISDIRHRFQHALAAERCDENSTSEATERQRWRRVVASVIDDIGDASDEAFEQLWNHFAQPQHWRLYHDVQQALGNLSRRGYLLGIASNFDGRLHSIVQGLPVLALCKSVFVSSEIGYIKPDRRFFAAVEQQLGARPSQIALIGDDLAADFQGATSAGWQAILLDRSGAAARPAIQTLAELSVEPPSRLH
jgi:putative hydrolase of the HAD superfamily